MTSLTINPPKPKLVDLLDVAEKLGGPVEDDIPTYSDVIDKFYLASGGVLPTIFGGGESAAFPGGGPQVTVGSNIAVVSGTQATLVLLDDEGTPYSVEEDASAGAASAIVWSPDRTLVVWKDGTGIVGYNLTTDTLDTDWPTMPGLIDDLAFSPDGTRLAVGHDDGDNLSVIDVSARTVESDWPAVPIRATAVAWSGNGDRLAVGHFGGNGLTVIDADTKLAQAGWPDLGDEATGLAWSPDGSLLIACYAVAGGFAAINTSSGAVLDTWPTFAGLIPHKCAWSPQGDRLAVGHTDDSLNHVTIIETDGLTKEAGWPALNPTSVAGFGWSPFGDRLAIATITLGLVVWDVEDQSAEIGWPDVGASCYGATFAADPGNVASS